MTTNIPTLPCNRGIKDNIFARGWHYFVANNLGVICCVFCGATPVTK